MAQNRVVYDLREAVAASNAAHPPTCPICRLVRAATKGYLESLLYEMVNDVPMREAIRQARGFCNTHAWQMQGLGRALGVSIIHHDVLGAAIAALRQASYQPAGSLSWGRLWEGLDRHRPAQATQGLVTGLEPKRDCPACTYRAEMQDVYLTALLEQLGDGDLAPELAASAGLCLPHLRRGLQLVRDEETFRRLVAWALAGLESLRDELAEFIRKSDYRFSEDGFGEEGDAWLRAIARVAGEEGGS
ncbi:MAG: hypothetical protein GX605_03550 [Chloroflexi bacterium]|nr:hypothetical protein [Chloroflexota bacterium]